jgi:hypothetical protein
MLWLFTWFSHFIFQLRNSFFFFLCGAGVLTQGFVLATQEVYHFSEPPDLSALVISETSSHFLPRLAWTANFLFPTSDTAFFPLEMGSYKFFSHLPGTVTFLIYPSAISWNKKCLSPCLAWLKWDLSNLFSGLA